MTRIDWRSRFLANMLSGYASTAISMLLGLVTFRLLYTSWSKEQFGFWVLLWSVVELGFLADFGLGVSVQRAMAQASNGERLKRANRVLSTAFWTFVALVPLYFVLCMLAKGLVFNVLDVSSENVEEFGRAYVVFAVAFGLLLPVGVFPEVLAGTQRLDILHLNRVVITIIKFIATVLALNAGAGFASIVLISCIATLAPGLSALVSSYWIVPGLSLNPFVHFSPTEVRQQVGFSLAAYFIAVSHRLLAQSDRVIIGVLLGLPSVAGFQVMDRIGTLLRLSASQVAALAAPAAAHLHANEGRESLRDFLCHISRFSFLIITPLYVLAAAYLPAVAGLLTGEPSLSRADWVMGQMVLFTAYGGMLAGSSAASLLIMTGEERVVVRGLFLLIVTNVLLSVALARPLGSVGVVLATLVCNSVYCWLFILVLAMRKVGMSVAAFARFHLDGCLPGFGAAAAALAALLLLAPLHGEASPFALAWRGLLVLLLALGLNQRALRSTWLAREAPSASV